MASTPALFDWRLDDLLPGLERIRVPSRANLAKYRYGGQVYVIKTQPHAPLVERELKFLKAAADISVEVKGYIRRNRVCDDLVGFVMPWLQKIEPSKLSLEEKINVFEQIRVLIPQLHDRYNIIHGDIKLNNMLLQGNTVKLSDFGTSAWMSEVIYPTAFTVTSSSPYRLGCPPDKPRPLIPEEDLYASGIAVWELFVEEDAFGSLLEDEEELWDTIASGVTVDVDRIQFQEARCYVQDCLSIKECAKVD